MTSKQNYEKKNIAQERLSEHVIYFIGSINSSLFDTVWYKRSRASEHDGEASWRGKLIDFNIAVVFVQVS